MEAAVAAAAALPDEVRNETASRTRQAESFDKREFLDRISGVIEKVDVDVVENEVQAMLRALREWAPEGQMDDTIAQLPHDLGYMFR